MANSFASISSAAGILKNWYAGPLVSQFSDSVPFYKHIEKGKEKSAGLQVVRSLKVRRNNAGIGATSDGGTLPAIGQQGYAQATIAYKMNYLRFGVTGPMLKASSGDKGAFVSIMESEMEQGLADFKSNFNRQLWWSGTGQLATVSANAVGTNVVSITGRQSTDPALKWIDIGTVLDFYTSAGVPVATGVSVTAVSGSVTAASVTITLSANVTVSATDLVILSGCYGNELQGLKYTLDGSTTSTVYGISRSTYPSWTGNVLSNSSAQLTLDFMQNGWNQGKLLGDAHYDACFVDFNSERFYNKLLVADKRFIGRVPGDGSFSNKDMTYLEFGGIPVVADKDMMQSIAFIDSKTWKKYVLSELEWCDETGSYMIAQNSADSFEIRLRHLANLFCEKPRANVLLDTYVSP